MILHSLHVTLQDDDLRELRDTREWMDMLATAKGGLSREAKINLRSEAKVETVCHVTSTYCRV